MPLTHLIHAMTLPATAGWSSFVRSASDAVADLSGAKHMLIALGVLAVLYINLRLARWLSASIKFDPPHHQHKHHDHTH